MVWVRRYEAIWFRLMLARKRPLVVAFFLPYWMIRIPALLLAAILRHTLKKHADRFES